METSYENPAIAASCMDYVNSVRSLENWQSDLKYVRIFVAVFKAHDFLLQLKNSSSLPF